jgi:hypothetical protein
MLMAQERRDVVITGDAEAWLQQRELVCITRAADGDYAWTDAGGSHGLRRRAGIRGE